MPPLHVGEHLSLGTKPDVAVETTAAKGFTSMQIFASSPGAWRPPIMDAQRTATFVQARLAHGVTTLVIHAIYLINLASADPLLAARSRSSLTATMRAGAAMGASAVITHIGSHAGRGFDAVVDQIAGGVASILAETPDEIDLALENSAGQGAIVGSTIEELGEIVARAGRPQRLKIALDTAHLCGAGWDFQESETAERLVRAVDTHVGLDRVAAIHANDSARPPGSRRDRHANIGDGHIGDTGFAALLAQPSLGRMPWILETPDLERREQDRQRLQALSLLAFEREQTHAGA